MFITHSIQGLRAISQQLKKGLSGSQDFCCCCCCWMCRVWATQACWVNPSLSTPSLPLTLFFAQPETFCLKLRSDNIALLLRILHSLPLVTQPPWLHMLWLPLVLCSPHLPLPCSLYSSYTGLFPVPQNHNHILTSGHLFLLPRMCFPQTYTWLPPWPHHLTPCRTSCIFPPYHLSFAIILCNLLLYCSLLVSTLECHRLMCVICLFTAASLMPRLSARSTQ